MTTSNTPKSEFADNNLKDSPADRDIWDKLLGSEESEQAIEEMVKQAADDEKAGKLSPMDDE